MPKIHALTGTRPQPARTGSERAAAHGVAPGCRGAPAACSAMALPAQGRRRLRPIRRCWRSAFRPAARRRSTFCCPRCRRSFPLPVLIVQHMPELFTRLFAERLNGRCKLRVREAAEGDAVRAGTIYIARGNWHMEVLAGARTGAPATLHLNQGPLENHCRPAVDVLFRSAAGVYGAGVLAVVLTGMGSDGMLGCRVIREHGGRCWPRTRQAARCGECPAR